MPKHGRDENRNRLKRARPTGSPKGGLEQPKRSRPPSRHIMFGACWRTRRGEGGEGERRKTGFRPKDTQQRLGFAPPGPRLWLAKRQKVPEGPRKRVNAGWILCTTRQRGKHMADRRRLVDSDGFAGGIGAPEALVKRAPSPIRRGRGQIVGLARDVTPDRGRRLEQCSAQIEIREF